MGNLIKDILLSAFIFIIYFVGRLALLLLYNENQDVPSLLFYIQSARFDLLTSAYFVLLTFILTIISLFVKYKFTNLKLYYANFAIFISILIALINICFFAEYKSQYNYWIFGIFYDDFKLILKSIISSFPIFKISFGFCIVIYLFNFIIRNIYSNIDKIKIPSFGIFARIACSILMVFCLVIAIRGGKLSGAPFRISDVSTLETSQFLNNIMPSSAYCLKYEIQRFIDSKNSNEWSKFSASPQDIPTYIKSIFKSDSADLNKILTKKSDGTPLKEIPTRIFFIVMESHSSWPIFNEFHKYKLLPETIKLYDKSNLKCNQALPCGMMTMHTMLSLMSGIPYNGSLARMNFSMVSDKTYSLPHQLKKLGYVSNFYYSGVSTWCDLGDSARILGFDKFIGSELIGYAQENAEWGIRDKDFFTYISKIDIPEHSLNLILTTSNHHPFNVDLKSEGLNRIPKNENEKNIYHLWYADKCLGTFVEKILSKYPNSLIIITGDHPARVSPENEKFSNRELACVPIIFIGNSLANSNINIEQKSAQHLDIIPTIIELISPKNFEYKSWGVSLLKSGRKLPAMNPFFIEFNDNIYSLQSKDCPKELQELARKYFAISYSKSKQ